MNPGNDPETWKHAHRKTTAVSIANRLGWWYFSLAYQNGRFFDAPEIMAEIKRVQELYRAMRALPYRHFRPDVCFENVTQCLSGPSHTSSTRRPTVAMATVMVSTDLGHFHHLREFYWTALL